MVFQVLESISTCIPSRRLKLDWILQASQISFCKSAILKTKNLQKTLQHLEACVDLQQVCHLSMILKHEINPEV